jgi:hypothetical protein
VRIKLGIKAWSTLSAMLFSLAVISGCNEEPSTTTSPAPSPAPGPAAVKPADTGKPAPAQTPPPPTKTDAEKH